MRFANTKQLLLYVMWFNNSLVLKSKVENQHQNIFIIQITVNLHEITRNDHGAEAGWTSNSP